MALFSKWTWVRAPTSLIDMLDKFSSCDEADPHIIIDVLVNSDAPQYDNFFITYLPANGAAHLYVVSYVELGDGAFNIYNEKHVNLRGILESSKIKKAVRNPEVHPAIVYMRYWIQMQGIVSIDQVTPLKRDRARFLWNEVIANLGFDLGLPVREYRTFVKRYGQEQHVFVPRTGNYFSLPIHSPSRNGRSTRILPKTEDILATEAISSKVDYSQRDNAGISAPDPTDPQVNERSMVSNLSLGAKTPLEEAAQINADERIVDKTMAAVCRRTASAKQKMCRGRRFEDSETKPDDENESVSGSKAQKDKHMAQEDKHSAQHLHDKLKALMAPGVSLSEKLSILEQSSQSSKTSNPGRRRRRDSSLCTQHGSADGESCSPDQDSKVLVKDMEEIQINSPEEQKESEKDDFEHLTMSSESSWDMVE